MPHITILLVATVLVLVGCSGTGVEQPPGPTQAVSCVLRVLSTSPNVWGYVWVNGMNTGVYLDPMGVVQVGSYPCGQEVRVQIVDEFGEQSHIEVVFLSGGITTVNFSWW
ncbi:MAG: hypothetical protein N2205_05330 [Candidatus Caldatribacterium sp.]|uniref:hypothetical protein n=1 Tax=Candidatus Caldatribacterium sp. TaxID=2282143 RepID=UPI002994A39A|nr:hypothetical protein [Candidatus Caldatribacterium sp.]MCX7730619.1 hypothetical protein [Candidatus Caldatribacterium sp.]MDW8081589.1 hypothetical protein [Candidatus Calescibacterium sp.]